MKVKENNQKGIFSRLLSYMGPFKILIVLSVILAAAGAVINLYAYVSVYNVAKEIIKSGGQFSLLDQERLIYLGKQVAMLVCTSFGAYGLSMCCSHIAAFNTVARLRIKIMKYIGELPLGWHSENPSGKVRKIIEKNTDNLEEIIAHQVPNGVQSIAMPIAFLVFMFVYDWRLSLICMIPIIVGFLILASMMKGNSQIFIKQYQKSAEDMSNAAVEYVRGISVVKIFGQTARSFKRYATAVKDYTKFLTDYALSMKNTDSAYATAINGIFFVLIPGGIILFNAGKDPEKLILSFIFFSVLIPAVVTILTKIMNSSSNMMICEESLNTIDDLLNEKQLPSADNPKKPTSFDIDFENVIFKYTDNMNNVLDNFNLHIKEGTVTALVGQSGGGKSTVANLIARFWDVKGGSVKIGGTDIRELDYDDWMKKVSIVFQDSNMLKMSIADNVAFFKPNADRKEIMNALHLAQCDDIIAKFPNGADTIIGSEGVYLSGGEMQRIAIARAILKDAPVILLDEATAFEDAENEFLIQKALNVLLKGKTVVMIAHRLSTVVNADQICVIQCGHIIEKGKHKELIKKNGVYKKMFDEYENSISWKVGGADNA